MTYFLLVLLGSIWGASYLFIKLGGQDVPPVTLVMVRVVLAGLILFLVAKLRGENLPPRRAPIWKWFGVLGLLNTVVPYTLITWGEHFISSGLAAILVGAMPIFTVLLAHWLTHDEKMSVRKVVGVIAGFIGVVILFLPDFLQAATANIYGGLAVVGAAVSYALATIIARRHVKGVSHFIAPLGQMATAAVVLIPASLLLDQPWTLSPSPVALGSILALSIVGTAFAYLMYFWLIANVGATRTSLVTYISPVIAVVLGWLVLQEALQWTTFIGLVLIIAGVGLVTNLRLGKGSRSEAFASVTAKPTQ